MPRPVEQMTNRVRLGLFLIVCCLGRHPAAALEFEHLIGEKLLYTMTYKGLPSARAELRMERNGDGFAVTLIARTRTVFDPLFKIDNRYTASIDADGRLVTVTKKVDQKNIRDDMVIRYAPHLEHAEAEDGRGWRIMPNCTNLLVMLYDLRRKNPQPGDSLSYILDVESQLWKIDGAVTQIDGERQIVFGFTPAQSINSRSWRTDLLTHRLARRDSQLIVRLGPPPANVPRRIAFGSQDNRVEMKLGN